MARYRLAEPAKADIAAILRRSEELHGKDARMLSRVSQRRNAPHRRRSAGRSTVDRADLVPGIRSFHFRHSRDDSREAPVANPVHVIFYRVVHPGIVEIVRVLHDRMEPRRHVSVEAR